MNFGIMINVKTYKKIIKNMNNLKTFEEWNPFKKQPSNKIDIPPEDLISMSKVIPRSQYRDGQNPHGIPYDIQSEYNTLASRLMDGSADPDIWEVEDRIEEIRKLYPQIKPSYLYK